MTVTRSDLFNYVVFPACGEDFETAVLQRITDAVLAAAPLPTWRFIGGDYVSSSLDEPQFWALVEQVATNP